MATDIIGALYRAANDDELDTLSEIMIRAGLMWRCPCGDTNRADEPTCHRAGDHARD